MLLITYTFSYNNILIGYNQNYLTKKYKHFQQPIKINIKFFKINI